MSPKPLTVCSVSLVFSFSKFLIFKLFWICPCSSSFMCCFCSLCFICFSISCVMACSYLFFNSLWSFCTRFCTADLSSSTLRANAALTAFWLGLSPMRHLRTASGVLGLNYTGLCFCQEEGIILPKFDCSENDNRPGVILPISFKNLF